LTKQHYIAIAEEFKAAIAVSEREGIAATNATYRAIEGFAAVAAQVNPNFNRSRFLKAWGVSGY